MRKPIEAASTFFTSKIDHSLNQCGTCAFSTLRVFDIEILEIAGPFWQPAGAVKDHMDDANKASIVIKRAQCVHGLRRIVKATPCNVSCLYGNVDFVKDLIGFP
jgi:hypothetical protein